MEEWKYLIPAKFLQKATSKTEALLLHFRIFHKHYHVRYFLIQTFYQVIRNKFVSTLSLSVPSVSGFAHTSKTCMANYFNSQTNSNCSNYSNCESVCQTSQKQFQNFSQNCAKHTWKIVLKCVLKCYIFKHWVFWCFQK